MVLGDTLAKCRKSTQVRVHPKWNAMLDLLGNNEVSFSVQQLFEIPAANELDSWKFPLLMSLTATPL